MEPKQNVEFRTGSGTVSPFVLDNFTRYALPELAKYGGSFVVQHGEMEVGFGEMKDNSGYSNRYIVALREQGDKASSLDAKDNNSITQKVFHFLGNNMIQSCSLSDAGPVMPDIRGEALALELSEGPVTHTMPQEDLQKIITVLVGSEKIEGRALGILQRLCSTEYYGLASKPTCFDAAVTFPMRHAQVALESAVQLLAADERLQDGVRRREATADITQRATRHDSCVLTIGTGEDDRPLVQSILKSWVRQSCEPHEIAPNEIEAASISFYDQYPQMTSAQACYDVLQDASQAGTLCRQNEVTYTASYSYTAGVLERVEREVYLVLGKLISVIDVSADFSITTKEVQDYFMSNQDAAKPFEGSQKFGGYFLPHSQNLLTQYHLEEMTAALGRLGLLLRPTRWG